MSQDLSRLSIDRTPAPRSGRGGWIVTALLLIAIAFLLWSQRTPSEADAPEVQLSRVLRIGGAKLQSGVAANGYVVARKRAALSTDIPGRVVEINVEEGTAVEQGFLVARLDTRQLEAQLAQAKANLEVSQATRALSELEKQRFQMLYNDGHATESERDVASSRFDESVAIVKQRAATVDEFEVMIDKSSVYAPFAGVIIEKNAEVGEIVSASSAGSNARGAVATLVDFSTLEVQVELAQKSLPAARQDAAALIYLDAYPEDAYRGRVRQIWPTGNRQNASVEVRIEFVERDDRILPEMGVRVVFSEGEEVEAKPARILVPQRAIVQRPDPSVFVVGSNGVRLQSIVTDGPLVDRQGDPISTSSSSDPDTKKSRNAYLAVRTGLTGGERVVLAPPADLNDGDPVRLKENSP